MGVDLSNFADEVFGRDGVLVEWGLEFRLGQYQLAQALQESLYTSTIESCALLEGETGVGKTKVYAAGALAWAVSNGTRVVIAVSSNKLLDQVTEELRRLSTQIGRRDPAYEDLTVAALKGRSHYLCNRKFFNNTNDVQALEMEGLTSEDRQQLRDLREWYETVGSMDLSQAPMTISETVRRMVTIERSACRKSRLGNQKLRVLPCPYGDPAQTQLVRCATLEARSAALAARIVVTNMSLLAIDAEDGRIMGSFDLKIIDEAHLLHDTVQELKGKTLNEKPFLRASKRIRELVEENEDDEQIPEAYKNLAICSADRLEAETKAFFQELHKRTLAASNSTESDESGELRSLLSANAVESGALKERLDDLALAAEESFWLATKIGEEDVPFDLDAREQPDLDPDSDARRHILDLRKLLSCADEESATWIETDKNRRKPSAVRTVPGNAGKFVWKAIRASATAAFSATLSIDGDFSYARSSMGVPENTVVRRVKSPFRFEDQLLVYVPDGIPHPSRNAAGNARYHYNIAVAKAARELTDVVGGRSLVLYTSRKDLNDNKRFLDGLKYRVLVQGIDAPGNIDKIFRDDPRSCLLGLCSYGTGFDVQGEALECVHVWRLPFPAPTPLDTWKRLRIGNGDEDAGRNLHFSKDYLPRMLMELRQWFGRVIRSETDIGVLAVYDPRVRGQDNIGKAVRKTLPEGARITNSLAEVKAFLTERRARLGR